MTSAALLADRLPLAAKTSEETLCAHCGAALAQGTGRFCCTGCAGAYRLITELGLAHYYAGRALDPEARLPRPPEESAAELAIEAPIEADGTATLHLLVDGLHCSACVWLIETALQRQPETVEARVNLTSRRLRLRWRGDGAAGERLLALVQRLGYRVIPFDPIRSVALAESEERRLLRALAVAGFAAANIMLLSVAVWSGLAGEMGTATRDLLHWVSALIALPAIAYAGQPFFRSAIGALRQRRTNMDVPISIGVTLAAAMSLYETMVSGPHAYFDSAVTLLFFLLIGRYLDLRARGRARSAAEHLVGLMAQGATVIAADGSTHRAPASAIVVGDTVLVAVGERIAVDGRIVAGSSSVDKSVIDGESLPVPASAGDTVLAGMLNLAAPLRVTVTATGERTFLAEIVRLMEAAEQGRARLVLLADRVARRYAPAVHGLALVTFIAWLFFAPWQAAMLNAVAVLIITCPCALGLAVPVVQVIASGRLMRRGILLKSATALERLATVDTVVFDKTGTLTLGRLELLPESLPLSGDAAGLSGEDPRALRTRVASDEHPSPSSSAGLSRASTSSVSARQVVDARDTHRHDEASESADRALQPDNLPRAAPQGERELFHRDLALAASLAATSRHPLSQALARACPGAIAAADVVEHPGLGLSLTTPAGEVRLGNRAFCGVGDAVDDGAPELWLAQPGATPTRFVFADRRRPDAAVVIAELRRSGRHVVMLSGDRPLPVGMMARELGIDACRAQVSPSEKQAMLASLAAEGRTVLMVGDGLNDAPALAAAHVSMSPATAADVCQAAADVVFQGQSLAAVTETLETARRAGRLVRQNLVLAIAYNIGAVPLAMLGLVTPLLAAVAMSSSSLLVVGNALRLAGRRV